MCGDGKESFRDLKLLGRPEPIEPRTTQELRAAAVKLEQDRILDDQIAENARLNRMYQDYVRKECLGDKL